MTKINQNWVFGNNAGLSFATGAPVSPPGSSFAIVTNEGCASVSDANGNLLFYTDGIQVWDGNNNPISTPGLAGHTSSSQSSIIVPKPGSSNEYYIFSADGSSGSSNFIACVLLNTSSWTSSDLTNSLPLNINYSPLKINYSPTEKITAIQHANCKDFFVVTLLQKDLTDDRSGQTAETGDGVFRVLRIDASGITHVADTDILVDKTIHDMGYLKASPNGKRIAFANWELSKILLFSFDNTTGAVGAATPTTLTVPDPLPLDMTGTAKNTGHDRCVYGLEFSPNSDILYFTVMAEAPSTTTVALSRGYLYQADLLTNGLVLIDTLDNGTTYPLGALQMGMDGIIYVAQFGKTKLGAIKSPDVLGTGCNLLWDAVTLSTGQCRHGLPNLLPNPCPEDGDCDCGCGCSGCNENAEEQNEELIERAKTKYYTVKSNSDCKDPFMNNCDTNAVNTSIKLEPCFYFHWGEGKKDQIEEHDTEVFYITVCNHFSDIQFNGLRITKINIIPDTHPIEKIQIVPDRFISLDCIAPCSCQTREFAIITRATDTAGNYKMEVEYCFDNITLTSGAGNYSGKVEFDFEITED